MVVSGELLPAGAVIGAAGGGGVGVEIVGAEGDAVGADDLVLAGLAANAPIQGDEVGGEPCKLFRAKSLSLLKSAISVGEDGLPPVGGLYSGIFCGILGVPGAVPLYCPLNVE